MKLTITKICTHHTGGMGTNNRASTRDLTEERINAAHKLRWPDFPSELNNSYIGYNVVVFPNGSWKQYRYVGEETAAAIGSNFDTFHICAVGNFSRGVDTITPAQVATVQRLIKAALSGLLRDIGVEVKEGTTLNFSLERIYPHRLLARPGHTECHGSSLPDDWGRQLARAQALHDEQSIDVQISTIDAIILQLLKIKDALTKSKRMERVASLRDRGDDIGFTYTDFAYKVASTSPPKKVRRLKIKRT